MRTRRKAIGVAVAFLISIVGGGYYVAIRPAAEITNIATLIDPAKLATLRADRAANGRLLKCIYWLEHAKQNGRSPDDVAMLAVKLAYPNQSQQALVKKSLLRNLQIAEELGCTNADNLERMRRGVSPIIARGPYTGEEAEVDHIIPIAVVPRWSNNIANLELLPRTLNRRKGSSMGSRQTTLKHDFVAAGM